MEFIPQGNASKVEDSRNIYQRFRLTELKQILKAEKIPHDASQITAEMARLVLQQAGVQMHKYYERHGNRYYFKPPVMPEKEEDKPPVMPEKEEDKPPVMPEKEEDKPPVVEKDEAPKKPKKS